MHEIDMPMRFLMVPGSENHDFDEFLTLYFKKKKEHLIFQKTPKSFFDPMYNDGRDGDHVAIGRKSEPVNFVFAACCEAEVSAKLVDGRDGVGSISEVCLNAVIAKPIVGAWDTIPPPRTTPPHPAPLRRATKINSNPFRNRM